MAQSIVPQFNDDFVGPPAPFSAMGGPTSNSSLGATSSFQGALADALRFIQSKQDDPDYSFRGVGEGILGGLFNLIGGIFGNSDLGGQLFGRRETGNTELLVNTLAQLYRTEQEGLQFEKELNFRIASEREDARQAERNHQNQIKLMEVVSQLRQQEAERAAEIETERLRLQDELEVERMRTQVELNKNFQGWSDNQKRLMAKFMVGIERGNLEHMTSQDIRKMHAEAHFKRYLSAEARAHEREMLEREIEARGLLQSKQLEAADKISERETTSREKIVGQQIQSQEKIAGQQIQSEEKIAGQRLQTQETVAGIQAGADLAKEQGKMAEKARAQVADMATILDSASQIIGDQATELIRDPSVGFFATAAEGLKDEPSQQQIEKDREWLKTQAMRQLGTYNDSPQDVRAQLGLVVEQEATRAADAVRQAVQQFRGGDPMTPPEFNNELNQSHLNASKAIAGRQRQLMGLIDDVVEEVEIANAVDQNLRQIADIAVRMDAERNPWAAIMRLTDPAIASRAGQENTKLHQVLQSIPTRNELLLLEPGEVLKKQNSVLDQLRRIGFDVQAEMNGVDAISGAGR